MKVFKVYKLTDQNMRTYRGFQWKLGKWHKTSGKGDLCSASWLHFYSDPLIAVFMNPIHAQISRPLLFEAEAKGKSLDDNGLKIGYTQGRITKQIELPVFTTEQLIEIAIRFSLLVYNEKSYVKWAKGWLSGKDRTYTAANAAYNAADVAYNAADAAAYAAANAAADAATHAAGAAYNAAYAAYVAANAARAAGEKIDLLAIIKQVIEKK